MRVADLIPSRSPRGGDLTRSRTRDPIDRLQSEVNTAFGDFMRLLPLPFGGWQRSILENDQAIQADVFENDKEVKVTAELPGLDQNDIAIEISDGMLTISGEKKVDREVNEQGYVLRERSFGRLERTLPLPDQIDADHARATFKSGVLTVIIPRSTDAQSEVKRIPVRA